MPHVELPQTEFKVVILGDTNIGKTSLVLRFTEGYYSERNRSPTLGAFFLTKRVQTSSNVTAKVQIWDTAGKPQFRQMAPIYWRSDAVAAILVCYDVSNVRSWEVAVKWLQELRNDSHVLDKNIVLVLVATKSDLLYQYHELDNKEDYDDNGTGTFNNGEEFEEEEKKKKEMVPMAQVEQVLQSMNNQHHNRMMMIPLTPQHYITGGAGAAAAAAAGRSNTTINNNSNNTNKSTNNYNSGNGQILHIHTSARLDDNINLLFQKVAEEVLYVREQERYLWMNYGIKYKHYNNAVITAASDILSNQHYTEATDGNFIGRQQQQQQQHSPSPSTSPRNIHSKQYHEQNGNNPNVQHNEQQHNHHYDNNKENNHHNHNRNISRDNSANMTGGTSSYTHPVSNDSSSPYPLHRDDTNELLKKYSSNDDINNGKDNDAAVSNGLCYSAGCGSSSTSENSSSCIIS